MKNPAVNCDGAFFMASILDLNIIALLLDFAGNL
jgi:hypothetical protein